MRYAVETSEERGARSDAHGRRAGENTAADLWGHTRPCWSASLAHRMQVGCTAWFFKWFGLMWTKANFECIHTDIHWSGSRHICTTSSTNRSIALPQLRSDRMWGPSSVPEPLWLYPSSCRDAELCPLPPPLCTPAAGQLPTYLMGTSSFVSFCTRYLMSVFPS